MSIFAGLDNMQALFDFNPLPWMLHTCCANFAFKTRDLLLIIDIDIIAESRACQVNNQLHPIYIVLRSDQNSSRSQDSSLGASL